MKVVEKWIMLLPNYTKWSGMSCGGKMIMMSCGREKGGVLDKW